MGKEFDELSKALASGVSRRRALRRFVGGVVGAALASVIPWQATDAVAKKKKKNAPNLGNSVCVKLCKEHFPPGEERGRCISASAKCPEGSCAAIVVNNVPMILSINDTEPICLKVPD